MCGIVGIGNLKGEPVSVEVLKRMTETIVYRGPDGGGCFTDGPVGLGHRRLAILDLSEAGHQPMTSPSGGLTIVYNGEVYNFLELRRELEGLGHRFRSQTDTEVVLAAYEQWGKACLDRFNGMFAFGIWDSRRKTLFLARDRYGIKPLYWYCKGGCLIFSSEIKAILAHPQVSRGVCYPALEEYFTFQNVLSDLTLFDGIRLLPPGHTLTLQVPTDATPRLERYWDFILTEGLAGSSEEECAGRLHELIVEAVSRQLISDVPVGSYLSGGIDSGSITAVAVRHLPRLSTFTGGFDLTSASGLELAFDERANAEALSNLFKTEHYEVIMHAGDMEAALSDLVWHLEDLRVGQCYPNYYVARLASKFVKVVLSGTGGDELFGGYPWRYYRGVHSSGRETYFQDYYAFWQRLVPDADKPRLFSGETSRRIGDYRAFDQFCGVFDGWRGGFAASEERLRASLYFELKTFLHGLLVMEDRLSMAHGLETRVPLLDNDVVDFAVQIPIRYKLRGLESAASLDENLPGKRLLYEQKSRNGKWVLRQAMSRLLPRAITERAKQGFSAPDASWFRGESIDYINRLLRDPKAMLYAFLTPAYVSEVLDQHCSGLRNRRLLVWSLLCFEWWCRSFLRASSSAARAPAHRHEPIGIR